MDNRKLQTLKRKLERMELEHLRAHAAALAERLEQAEAEVESLRDSANFWQRDAMLMQEMMHDENFSTHRCVGITRSGELMVVKHDA